MAGFALSRLGTVPNHIFGGGVKRQPGPGTHYAGRSNFESNSVDVGVVGRHSPISTDVERIRPCLERLWSILCDFYRCEPSSRLLRQIWAISRPVAPDGPNTETVLDDMLFSVGGAPRSPRPCVFELCSSGCAIQCSPDSAPRGALRDEHAALDPGWHQDCQAVRRRGVAKAVERGLDTRATLVDKPFHDQFHDPTRPETGLTIRPDLPGEHAMPAPPVVVGRRSGFDQVRHVAGAPMCGASGQVLAKSSLGTRRRSMASPYDATRRCDRGVAPVRPKVQSEGPAEICVWRNGRSSVGARPNSGPQAPTLFEEGMLRVSSKSRRHA